MKKRFTMVLAALALVTSMMTTGAGPAQAASNACVINSGTIVPVTPFTLTTVTTATPFSGVLNVTCPTGPSGAVNMTGNMLGTCSVWVATATFVSSSLWGSASATVTITPPLGFSVSGSVTLTMTVVLQANGQAGVSCLGTTTTVSYWTVTGVMAYVNI